MRIPAVGLLLIFVVSLRAQDSIQVNQIRVTGNRITRSPVVLRELTIRPGMQLDSSSFAAAVAESRNRLINLGIFNHVRIGMNQDTLSVQIRDRLPVFGYPRFALADRNFRQWWETRDFSRTVYGIWGIWRNVGGWNHRLTLQLLHGYTEWAELSYRVPFRKQDKSWSWTARTQFTANHEVWYKTENNRLQFLKLDRNWGQVQWNGGLTLAFRPTFYTWLEAEPSWQYFRVADTIVSGGANPGYLKDGSTRQTAAWLSLRLVRDTRIRRDYPVDGSLLRLELRPMQINSGIATSSHCWLAGRYAMYRPFAGGVGVLGAYGRYASGKLPYTYGRVMGYGADYVRGYEAFVAEGNGYILFKTAWRYPLWFDRHVHPEKWVPNKLLRDIPVSLWLNVFADAGRVVQPFKVPGNDLASSWMRGVGIGLDVLAFYDRMLRFEISLGPNNQPSGNLSFINAF